VRLRSDAVIDDVDDDEGHEHHCQRPPREPRLVLREVPTDHELTTLRPGIVMPSPRGYFLD